MSINDGKVSVKSTCFYRFRIILPKESRFGRESMNFLLFSYCFLLIDLAALQIH